MEAHQEAAFLRTIAASPRDEACRRVYADWLEEQGEPAKCEFIRTECQWAVNSLPWEHVPQDDDWRQWPERGAAYPEALWKLSRLASQLEIPWMAEASWIAAEIKSCVDDFSALVTTEFMIDPPAITAPDRCQNSVTAIRKLFSKLVGGDVTERRYCVPIDYLMFLCVADQGVYCPHEGMTFFDVLFDASRMAKQVNADCMMYAEDTREAPMLAACGLWLHVGFRDKHDFHVCCDLELPCFGLWVDQHDSHPWIYPPHRPGPWDMMSLGVLDFFAEQINRAKSR